LSEFCCWKFKQTAEIGFGRKNQLSPQFLHMPNLEIFHYEDCANIFFCGKLDIMWHNILKLQQNMCLVGASLENQQLANWLLEVGSGKLH